MKRRGILLLAVFVLSLSTIATAADVEDWTSIVVRNSSSTDTPPQINDVTFDGWEAKEFIISEGGMKAAWGTDLLNGLTIGEIDHLSISRLDDFTRFNAGSGPYIAPYFNIWVTDGNDNYAVIANQPSNQPGASSIAHRWDIDGVRLLTLTAMVYENDDKSWITDLDLDDDGILTFEELASLMIEAPSVAKFDDPNWTGHGGGAPRELDTNIAYGFNWVFGDTQSNYVAGDTGYVVTAPMVLPVPGIPGVIDCTSNGGCFLQQVAQ